MNYLLIKLLLIQSREKFMTLKDLAIMPETDTGLIRPLFFF